MTGTRQTFLRRVLGFLLLLVYFIGGTAATVAAGAPKSRAALTSAKSKPQKVFMWKVSGKAGTVYLLGSIHLVRPNFYPLPSCIEKSFAASNQLVLEIDETKSDKGTVQEMTMARGFCRGGDTIANHISEGTLAALKKFLGGGEKSQAAFMSMRPWLVSMLLPMQALQKRGFDPNFGVDKHFLQEALKQSKPIGELESAQYQINLLSSFDDAMQDKLLMASLVDMENTDKDAATMVHAWKNGDADELEKFIGDEESQHPELKEFMDQLLYQRNAKMAEKIDLMLQTPGTSFVVVGAAHLIGPRGLIKLLQDKNYKVEQQYCN